MAHHDIYFTTHTFVAVHGLWTIKPVYCSASLS